MHIPLIIAFLFLLINCSKSVESTPVAGGSDTESMVTAEIFGSDSHGASNVLVKFVPQNFTPTLSKNDSVKVYSTDSEGKVSIPAEELHASISYAILVQDTAENESQYSAVYAGEKFLSITLEPSRSIEVKLDYGGAYAESDSALVFFKGTDIVRLCLGDFKIITNIPLTLDSISVANDTIHESHAIKKNEKELIFSISQSGITYF